MDVSCCYSLPAVMLHHRALPTTAAVHSLQQQWLLPENDVSTKTSSQGPKTNRLSRCPPSSTIEEFRRWQYSISPCHTSGGSLLLPTGLLLAPCCSSPLISKKVGSTNEHGPSFFTKLRWKHGPVPTLLTRRPPMRLDRNGSLYSAP